MKIGPLIWMVYLFVVVLLLTNIVDANYFIDVKIPLEYLSVNPGDSISANIKIVKISGDTERDDYSIKARIIDKYENVLIEKDEVIAIEEEVDTVISFNIPTNIESGEYKMEVIIGDNRSSAGFIVEENSKGMKIYFVYSIIIILLFLVVAFYYYNRNLNKLLKHAYRVSGKDLIKKR